MPLKAKALKKITAPFYREKNMEFRKKYFIELKDYMAYNMFFAKNRLIISSLIFITAVPALVIVISGIRGTLNLLGILITVVCSLIFAGVFVVLNLYLIKNAVKKQYKSDRTLHAGNEIAIDDTGIYVLSGYGNTNLTWPDIFKAAESAYAFYIFISKKKAFIIPKRVVDADEDRALRALTVKNLDADKRKLIS